MFLSRLRGAHHDFFFFFLVHIFHTVDTLLFLSQPKTDVCVLFFFFLLSLSELVFFCYFTKRFVFAQSLFGILSCLLPGLSRAIRLAFTFSFPRTFVFVGPYYNYFWIIP